MQILQDTKTWIKHNLTSVEIWVLCLCGWNVKAWLKWAFALDSRELWSPWIAKWFLSLSRPHTLFLTLSINFFVSLPASSSHTVWALLFPNSPFKQLTSAFTKQDKFSREIFDGILCFTNSVCRSSVFHWADIMCGAYMLLCHLMPHRTDSGCMSPLKIN